MKYFDAGSTQKLSNWKVSVLTITFLVSDTKIEKKDFSDFLGLIAL